MLFSLVGALQHQSLCQIKMVRGDDLKGFKGSGIGFAAPQDAFVKWVVQDSAHTGVVPILPLPILDTVVIEKVGKPPSAIAGRNTEIKHHPDNSGLIFVDDQHINLMLTLVEDTALFQPIPVWRVSSTEPPILYHLAKSRLGTHGGLLAFTVSLPETDVVGQAIRMGLKPLFPFLHAPDANPFLCEPLHHEGRFV